MVKVAFCDFYARNAVMGFESLTVNYVSVRTGTPAAFIERLNRELKLRP